MLKGAWDRWFARNVAPGAEHPCIPLHVARAASIRAADGRGLLRAGEPAELRVRSHNPHLIQQELAAHQGIPFVRVTDATSPTATALAALHRWPLRIETTRPYAAGLLSFDPAIAATDPAARALVDANFDFALTRFAPTSISQGDPPSPAELEAQFAPDGPINLLISTRRTDRIGEVGNVGDNFGLHLVRRLSGRPVRPYGLWAEPDMPAMLTVGSFIQHARDRGLVWGTGAIQPTHYADEPERTASIFLGVRGPRTREHLLRRFGLSPPVIGDPGLLIGAFAPAARREPDIDVGFVLHGMDREWFHLRVNRPRSVAGPVRL